MLLVLNPDLFFFFMFVGVNSDEKARRLGQLWRGIVELRAAVERMQNVLEEEFAHDLIEDRVSGRRYAVPKRSPRWSSVKVTLPSDVQGKLIGVGSMVRYGRHMEHLGRVKEATPAGFRIQLYDASGNKKRVPLVWRKKVKDQCYRVRHRTKP